MLQLASGRRIGPDPLPRPALAVHDHLHGGAQFCPHLQRGQRGSLCGRLQLQKVLRARANVPGEDKSRDEETVVLEQAALQLCGRYQIMRHGFDLEVLRPR